MSGFDRKLRSFLGRSKTLRVVRAVARTLTGQCGLNLRWLGAVRRLGRFAGEFRTFGRLNQGSRFTLRGEDIQPCLFDRTPATPLEPVYFYQDTWLARKLSQQRPARHVDVASSAKSLALIAQFVPVTMVDIRPVDLSVPGFTFMAGSILQLPFEDDSQPSLSSICVIEHIGLGRYGDPLDATGSEQAAIELRRVLAPKGDLYITVPVADENRIHFNAHRVFQRDYLISLFAGCELMEERYIYGREWVDRFSPDRGAGTGLFHFRKA